jgi:hypothetical protein
VTAKIDQIQAVSDDVAIAAGSWSSTFSSDNRPEASGVWLQVYKHQQSHWKIAASVFSRVVPVESEGK